MEEIKAHTHKWYSFGCKDATFLMTKAPYSELSTGERFLLRFHTLVCKYCRRFGRQSAQIDGLIRRAAESEGKALSPEKKEALNQIITKISR